VRFTKKFMLEVFFVLDYVRLAYLEVMLSYRRFGAPEVGETRRQDRRHVFPTHLCLEFPNPISAAVSCTSAVSGKVVQSLCNNIHKVDAPFAN
jgi:hypothetical protein